MDAMKRKALDQQLQLMVGHADKLSVMVQEGLQVEKPEEEAVEDVPEEDEGYSLISFRY